MPKRFSLDIKQREINNSPSSLQNLPKARVKGFLQGKLVLSSIEYAKSSSNKRPILHHTATSSLCKLNTMPRLLKNVKSSLQISVALIVLALFPILSYASGLSILKTAEKELIALTDKARPLVVSLSPYVPPSPSVRLQEQEGGRAANAGSGVILDGKKGLIVTNSHVVRSSQKIQVTLFGGEEVVGEVLGADEDTDLAIVKIPVNRPLPSLTFGDSSKLKVGQFVIAVGNPYGLNDTTTFGIVSGLNRENINLSRYEDFIQTDASINPGNSGGPLIDLDGNVIGINSAIINYAQSIGFAIPSDIVQKVITHLMDFGEVQRGWLGVGIDSLSIADAQRLGIKSQVGILVHTVYKGEPADRAGIKVGDVIFRIGGALVESPNKMIKMIGSITPGQTVRIDILRDGKEQSISVALGELKKPGEKTKDPLLSWGIEVDDLGGIPGKDYYFKGLKGVVVTRLLSESIAAEKGMKEGDLISALNGQKISGKWEFEKILNAISVGSPVFLLLQRDEEKVHLTLVR